jgi:hypothetical protein
MIHLKPIIALSEEHDNGCEFPVIIKESTFPPQLTVHSTLGIYLIFAGSVFLSFVAFIWKKCYKLMRRKDGANANSKSVSAAQDLVVKLPDDPLSEFLHSPTDTRIPAENVTLEVAPDASSIPEENKRQKKTGLGKIKKKRKKSLDESKYSKSATNEWNCYSIIGLDQMF